MKTSPKGIQLIKSFEELKKESYLCPAGIWTIGYGHTRGVQKGQKITTSEAEHLLLSDILMIENVVNSVFKNGLPQNKFDALVSFAFNVGIGAFLSSKLLLKAQSNKNDPSIKNEFEKWIYAKGVKLTGLERRRKAEATLYFSDIINN